MHIVNEVLSADPRDGIFTRACIEERPVIAMRERTSTRWPEGIGRVK